MAQSETQRLGVFGFTLPADSDVPNPPGTSILRRAMLAKGPPETAPTGGSPPEIGAELAPGASALVPPLSLQAGLLLDGELGVRDGFEPIVRNGRAALHR